MGGGYMDIIKCAFTMSSSTSRIITTTRMKNVAHSCCSSFSGHIYNIRPLNMVHSRQLFQKRLFRPNEDCPSYLEEVSGKILKKCDGLPLAIIALSSLLANTERREELWNRVKDSVGRALERNPTVERMTKILSLSYFDLLPHLKTCLLYLSIFPEDSIIEKKVLIKRWIAERFIYREDRYTLYELGEGCFNELLNRSLIQPVSTNKYGKVKSCRVHDMILEFIKAKSIEENFVTSIHVSILKTETQSKVIRRLSLKGNTTMLTSSVDLSHVRSLNMFGNSVKIPYLEEFRHLRVLHLKHDYQLEEHNLQNIVRFVQLRYLYLKNIKIHKLPEQIGHLGCLEMMDLRCTDLEELPASFVNLSKFSHLLVGKGVKFPGGIAKMQALETLKIVSVYMQPFDFLLGLGQLKNLRVLVLDLDVRVGSITGDTNVVVQEETNKDNAIVSSLCKLGTLNLCSLTILKGGGLLQESLRLFTLRKLISWSSSVPRVPKWVSSVRNLQQLRLQVEAVKQDDLCVLGALRTLLILHLDGVTTSNERLRINGETGFQFLRIFNYDASYNSVDLMFVAGSMPMLEKLELNYFQVVEADSLDFGIKNLPYLRTVKCKVHGKVDIVGAVRTAMKSAVSTHPNHPSLLFKRVGINGDFYLGRPIYEDELL